MAEKTSTRAPYRVNFAGGFTDLREYYEAYDGAVIESAIGTYAKASLAERDDESIIIRQKRLGIEERGTVDDLNSIRDFYKVIIKHFSPSKGFKLVMNTDTEYGSGLGSSSASLVSIIGAFNGWLGKGMDNYEIAELAHSFERTKLNIHLGKQDPYATTFGGLNYIEFTKESIKVNRINLKAKALQELESALLLVNTAIPRPSESPLKRLAEMVLASNPHTIEHLDRMKEYAQEICDAIKAEEFERIGPLMYDEWLQKRSLLENISSVSIDRLFRLCMRNGATGGKLLGVGGGGYIFLVTNPTKRSKLAGMLRKKGIFVIEPRLVREGLTVR